MFILRRWTATSSGPIVQFRCHVSQVYSSEGLLHEVLVGRSLWFAPRTVHTRRVLLRLLSKTRGSTAVNRLRCIFNERRVSQKSIRLHCGRS